MSDHEEEQIIQQDKTELLIEEDVDKDEQKIQPADNDDQIEDDVFTEEKNNNLIDDATEAMFQCVDPINIKGHINYSCKGVDQEGAWEIKRRFNEFFKLREKIEQRWPGIPIPQLPPKKSLGNKDKKFINERRFYMERFLKKISQYPFILQSEEFQIFSRQPGEIEKALNFLPKPTTSQIYEQMKTALDIDISECSIIQKEKLNSDCLEFQLFAKTLVPMLTSIQKEITEMLNNKNSGIKDYKAFLDINEQYEELNLRNYVDGDESQMIFCGEFQQNQNVKENVTKLCSGLKNPYLNLYHWIKGEIKDIESLKAAILNKDRIKDKINKTDKDKIQNEKSKNDLQAGLKTLKTIGKDAQTIGIKIEIAQNEILSLSNIYDLITIYLGREYIPNFKAKKIEIYQKIIQQFNVMQINNAHQVANFWSQILANPKIKEAVDNRQQN